MHSRSLIIGLFAGVAGAALASAAFADPPARVGRIAYAEGDVSFQPAQDQDWTWAVPNYPVTLGQAFWTGESGRAELQVGGIEADLDSETEVDVSALRYGEMRLGLAQGSVSVDIRGMPVGGVTVSTPAGDVHLRGRGFYRVDVGAPQDDGGYPPAEVTVFQGEADAPGPQGFVPVATGQAATLYAGYDPQFGEAQDAAIDDWARDRLQAERAQAIPAVLQGMTGASELGRYGDFVETPDFGTVWFPREVDPDWAPYREGRWDWVAPWGYTWIDDAPWGFAPFHYGRWARIDGRWGWVPGQANAEPVWAPALVSFVGGFGGELGWVPLAPDEVYQPPYTVSDEYYRRANAANVSQTTFNTVVINRTVTNVTVNTYRNAPAVTVMRADALRAGAPVREGRAQVSAEALARAPVVAPTAEAPPPARPVPGPARAGRPAGPAAAPPPRLAATRAAIAAPNPGANHPPPIAGARPAPPPAPPAQGGPRPGLIAPAQARNPAAQHRQPPAPPPGAAGPAAQGEPRAPAEARNPPPQRREPPAPPPGEAQPAAPPQPPPPPPGPPSAGLAHPAPAPGAHRPAPPPGAAPPSPAAQAKAQAEARRKAAEKAAEQQQPEGAPPPQPPHP